MSDESWFLRLRGKVAGPFTSQQLQSMASRGRFTALHEVSRDKEAWQSGDTLFARLTNAEVPKKSSGGLGFADHDDDEPPLSVSKKFADEEEDDAPLVLELADDAPRQNAPRPDSPGAAGKKSKSSGKTGTDRSARPAKRSVKRRTPDSDDVLVLVDPHDELSKRADQLRLPIFVVAIFCGLGLLVTVSSAVFSLMVSIASRSGLLIFTSLLGSSFSVGMVLAYTIWHFRLSAPLARISQEQDAESLKLHVAEAFTYWLYIYRTIMWGVIASIVGTAVLLIGTTIVGASLAEQLEKIGKKPAIVDDRTE